jgi:Hypothetical glycosyl hydrolase 6
VDKKQTMGHKLTRREFLVTSAGAGVGLFTLSLSSSNSGALGTTEAKASALFELPAWYEENRVQGHTRLGIKRWLGEPEWTHAATGFKDLGAGAFSRHFKTGKEDPWWPSAVPTGPYDERLFDEDRYNRGTFVPAGRNIAQEMIDEAHSQGLKIIAYHWHMTDDTTAELHPDWVCRNPDGVPISHTTRGVHLDITGPFCEIVLQRLLELAEMGVDGFFFDGKHLPSLPRYDFEGCWGSALEENFRDATGLDAPTKPDRSDPVWQQWLDFKAAEIERTFAYWQDSVHAQYPDVVFIVSAGELPVLIKREMTTNLARVAGALKIEFNHAAAPQNNLRFFESNPDFAEPKDDIRKALGWTLMRDSAEGRPPRIGGVDHRNEDEALAFVAVLTSYGTVANVNVPDENVLEANDPEGETRRAALKAAFDLGNKVSPHLSYTDPLRWAAVHFSERSRNYRGGELRAAWEEVLWPVTGAFGTLVRERVPVGIVNDYQLENNQLGAYSLLFLTNRSELSPNQQQAVERFECRGGVVIENDPAWPWSDPERTGEATAALRAEVQEYLADVPVQVLGGPEKMHAVAFRFDGRQHRDGRTDEGHDDGRLVVAVTDAFSFVQAKGGKSVNNPASSAVSGVEVMWRTGHGLPEARGQGYLPRVFDAVSGQNLQADTISDGFKVTLPEFRHMALLVAEECSPTE